MSFSKMHISFTAPLDFQRTLQYIGRYENDQIHAIEPDRFYQVLGDERGYFLVEIREANKNGIIASIVKGDSDARRVMQVRKLIERTFGPDEHLFAFYDFAKKHPHLSKWVKEFYGLRLVGVVSLWECLAWSIIGQQVSVQAAFAVRSRFAHRAGAVVEWSGHYHTGFPVPEAVLHLSEKALRACGFSYQKAGYVRDLAAAVVSGELDEDAWLKLPADELRAKLISLRGIGPWSAEYAMMRVHCDNDACPYEDIGLRNAIAKQYNLHKQATIDDVRKITEDWKPFRGYGTFYIWFTLLNSSGTL